MSAAAGDEDQPDHMVTVGPDAMDRKVVHIEPKNADPAKRRRYTRAEVNERMDRLAESVDGPDPLMQELAKNAVSPAFASALAQNASMARFATDFAKNSPAMVALSEMARPYDKIAKVFGPTIPSGIDWASIGPRSGLGSGVVKGLGVFGGVKGLSGFGGISARFAETLADLEEQFPSKFAGMMPASTPMDEWRTPDVVLPDLGPNPVHETNARVGELVEILRAEREDHLRDRQRDAEALAEQKRKNAQDRALLRISEIRHRADVRKFWAGLGVGLLGAVPGILALFL